MRRYVSVKIFMCILSLSLFLLWYNARQKTPLQTDKPAIVYINNTYNSIEKVQDASTSTSKPKETIKSEPLKLKYILQWTSPDDVPFVYMGVGQKRFIENKCKYTNCYVTSNQYYLKSIKDFDVIVFAGPEVMTMDRKNLPSERSPDQKYVFASIESSDNYPVCSNKFDGIFNWTWTYRLDSDSRWGYIVVRDKQNNIIGPNKVMHWIKLEDMEPVSDDFKKSLKSKTVAAAWFVSNCFTKNRREEFAAGLKVALAMYDLTLDIYGRCGTKECSRDDEQECEDIIKRKYYFYLAFENSFGEDYVTEKLLHGLKNNAIPIVYGGANYTRFMPDGIYLDAKKLGPTKLAAKMYELINDPDKYADYFRWQNHYRYHRRNQYTDTDDYCGMCALLNNDEKMKTETVYENFRKWWDVPKIC